MNYVDVNLITIAGNYNRIANNYSQSFSLTKGVSNTVKATTRSVCSFRLDIVFYQQERIESHNLSLYRCCRQLAIYT